MRHLEETNEPQEWIEGEEPRGVVITIGWQVPVLLVMAIVALGAGVVIGRWKAGVPTSELSSAPVLPAPAAAPLVPPSNPAAAGVPANALPPTNLVQEGQVIALPPSNHPLVGQPAPDFQMRVLGTGEEVKLSDCLGKPVLIDFWATWCPPCRIEMPWLENVYRAHLQEDFVLLAVDAGERVPPSMIEQTVQQFVSQFGLTFPVLLGDNTYDVQRTYSVYGLPAAYLINREGVIVDVHTGMFPNQATLADKLQAILAPSTETTASQTCRFGQPVAN